MDKQRCQRCNSEEFIPTHQYFKFEGRVNYVCGCCFTTGNKWLYGTALKEPKPNPGRLYASGTITGREPSEELQTGREPGKKMLLKLELFRKFHEWFHTTTKGGLEKKTE